MFDTGQPTGVAQGQQRRLARRVALRVPVYCRPLDGRAPAFWAETVDISLRGICLRSAQPLFRPAQLRLSLRLPGGERRLHASAAVVNLRGDAGDVLVGLSFVDVSRESTVELCRFLFDR